MNKSLLALLLVCAIAGMAYAAPYEVEEQQDDDARQLIQLLQTLEANQQSVKFNKAIAQRLPWRKIAKYGFKYGVPILTSLFG